MQGRRLEPKDLAVRERYVERIEWHVRSIMMDLLPNRCHGVEGESAPGCEHS